MAVWGGSRASVKLFAASRAVILPASSRALGSWRADPRVATRDFICNASRVVLSISSVRYRLFLKSKEMEREYRGGESEYWNKEERPTNYISRVRGSWPMVTL